MKQRSTQSPLSPGSADSQAVYVTTGPVSGNVGIANRIAGDFSTRVIDGYKPQCGIEVISFALDPLLPLTELLFERPLYVAPMVAERLHIRGNDLPEIALEHKRA